MEQDFERSFADYLSPTFPWEGKGSLHAGYITVAILETGSISLQLIFKRFSHLTDQLTLKSITSSSCYILLYWLNLIYEFGDWLQANSMLTVTVTAQFADDCIISA